VAALTEPVFVTVQEIGMLPPAAPVAGAVASLIDSAGADSVIWPEALLLLLVLLSARLLYSSATTMI